MNYQLRACEEPKDIVARADLPDLFAAQSWARDWAQKNAAQTSYRLESAGGETPMLVFRTDYGQWYVMPLDPAAERAA